MRLAILMTLLLAPVLGAQTAAWLPDAADAFKRREHAMIEFNGRLWLMGGYCEKIYSEGYYFSTQQNSYNDIWSTMDGTTWRREVAAAPWAGRFGHSLTVMNGRIWLTGGKSGHVLRNDVWSSLDGIHWTQETQNAPWAERHDHTSVALNGCLCVMGGKGAQGALNDVWWSQDGVTWTAATTGAAWTARSGHSSVVHGGRAWLLGGCDVTDTFRHDVWSSIDGASWTLEVSAPAWARRTGQAVTVFNNRIWLSGGVTSSIVWSNEVWSSADGLSWTPHSGPSWDGRTGHGMAAFAGKLHVIGGFDGISNEHRRGIWTSTDGSTWAQAGDLWSGRAEACSAVFNNRLWVIGGSYKDDVWSTADGVNWVCEATQITGTPFGNHSVAVFNNRLWILGGEVIGQGLKGRVYSSPDGVNWTLETSNAWPIYQGMPNSGALAYSRALVHNGRMWMIGGMTIEYAYTDRIWSSSDGVNWTLEAQPAFLDGRAEYAACVFNGRMWVLCGVGGNQRDVWSSADGINWTQNCANAPFMACGGHECVVHNGKMWVLGGCAINGLRSEAWSSPDGANWTLETTGPWDRRWYHTAQSFNGGIYVMGGWTNEVTQTQENGVKANDVWCMVGGAAPQLTSSAPPATAVVGVAYSHTFTASGSPAPGIHAGALPAWLAFDPLTATISGTPAAADIGMTNAIWISAVNEVGIDLQSYQVTVLGPAPMITSTAVTFATACVPYTYTVTAAGGPPAPSLSASGLPAWLAFNPATGELAGTPGAADTGMSGTITITATNGTQPDGHQVFQILVQGTPAVFTSAPVTEAYVGADYLYVATADGLPAVTLSATILPAWLSFDPATGALSGRPGQGDVGASQVELRAATGWGNEAVQRFTINVPDPIQGGGSGGGNAGCSSRGNAGMTALLALLTVAGALCRVRRKIC